MRTHNPKYARSEYHTQLAKMSFEKIFDLTGGVYFHFYNMLYVLEHVLVYIPQCVYLYLVGCDPRARFSKSTDLDQRPNG